MHCSWIIPDPNQLFIYSFLALTFKDSEQKLIANTKAKEMRTQIEKMLVCLFQIVRVMKQLFVG